MERGIAPGRPDDEQDGATAHRLTDRLHVGMIEMVMRDHPRIEPRQIGKLTELCGIDGDRPTSVSAATHAWVIG